MKRLGYGVFIGVKDSRGNPIHIGDVLEFDPVEYGGPCRFIVELVEGEILHPGSTSDLSEFCVVVKSVTEEEL